MTHRERVIKALEHKEPDRVPVDLGAMLSTGIMGIAYNRLKAYLGISGGRTRMYDLWQQLAEPEIEILELIGADVLPVFISQPKKWKKSKLPDGSVCEVPDWFNPEVLPDGSQIIKNKKGHILARMPKNGYYFDSLYHPLQNINTVEDLKHKDLHSTMWSVLPVDDEVLDDLRTRVKSLYENTEYALMLNDCGRIYEWAQDLRGWDIFMMDLASNPKFAGYLLDILVEENIIRKNPACSGRLHPGYSGRR